MQRGHLKMGSLTAYSMSTRAECRPLALNPALAMAGDARVWVFTPLSTFDLDGVGSSLWVPQHAPKNWSGAPPQQQAQLQLSLVHDFVLPSDKRGTCQHTICLAVLYRRLCFCATIAITSRTSI